MLDALTTRVESNYPGYHLEVRGRDREPEYVAHRSALRQRAATTAIGLDCTALLQQYVAWFGDGHLFVGGRPPVSTAEDSVRLRAAAPRVSDTEARIIDYIDTERNHLDPVEGIWMDPAGQKIAIRQDGAAGRSRRFVAFVVESTNAAWNPGDVRAELIALPDGSYDVVLYDEVRARTRLHVFNRRHAGGGRLQRDGLLLHMAPVTWGKLHPVRPGQEGLIDPLEPRAPTARTLNETTIVFHVPSNVPSHAARLRALVEQYRGALARAETLIIDLRGNEGGSTFVTDVFMPFLITADQQPHGYLAGGAPAVLAAPDNIAYFERMSWAPPGLVQRLRQAEPGTLVPFADPADADPEPARAAPDSGVMSPRNVAILTDEMTVSAAEAFVLKAMRYGSVTLFGEPTGGSIDYQTVGIVRFGCREAGLYVGYPTIVGSDRLPEGGARATGIVPDVRIDADDADPIARILEYYARR
ncbi:MAG TPA: S41 family peptidase [Longimicrobiales bacterium]